MSSPLFVLLLLPLLAVNDARFVHLYDNGSVSFIHNSNVSLSLRNSSLYIDSLSDQPLYLAPSSCRLRNTTATLTMICGISRLLSEDNANLLDKVSGESYELLIQQRGRYLLKGHKSNYSLLVAFDDNEGCWSYMIYNHDCKHQTFLQQLCENLPLRLIDNDAERPEYTEKNEEEASRRNDNTELRTLYNISVLMIAIDCITFVLYISLIVFMIKLLRNAYEPCSGTNQRRTSPPPVASRRFYLVRTSNETEV